jgi:carbon starvation protein
VLAAQMGYLPGMLWILAGVVLAGAVPDFMVLFVSMRRDGRSLGELVRADSGDARRDRAVRHLHDHGDHPRRAVA